MPSIGVERRVVRGLFVVLVVAAALRLLASVVSGLGVLSQHRDGEFFASTVRAGNILLAFGAGGDSAGALLLLAALGLIWWERRSGFLSPPGSSGVVATLFLVTALAALARTAGYLTLAAATRDTLWTNGIPSGLFGLADVLICIGGVGALARLNAPPSTAVQELGANCVFAVDRIDGEVFSFFSITEATAAISAYSIEDDEFDFYADDGTVMTASVVDDRLTFARTDDVRRDELLEHLRRFARQHDLLVDPRDRDDPTAYAVPSNEWQALQLWPGWMRPLARLIRRLRGL